MKDFKSAAFTSMALRSKESILTRAFIRLAAFIKLGPMMLQSKIN